MNKPLQPAHVARGAVYWTLLLFMWWYVRLNFEYSLGIAIVAVILLDGYLYRRREHKQLVLLEEG